MPVTFSRNSSKLHVVWSRRNGSGVCERWERSVLSVFMQVTLDLFTTNVSLTYKTIAILHSHSYCFQHWLYLQRIVMNKLSHMHFIGRSRCHLDITTNNITTNNIIRFVFAVMLVCGYVIVIVNGHRPLHVIYIEWSVLDVLWVLAIMSCLIFKTLLWPKMGINVLPNM